MKLPNYYNSRQINELLPTHFYIDRRYLYTQEFSFFRLLKNNFNKECSTHPAFKHENEEYKDSKNADSFNNVIPNWDLIGKCISYLITTRDYKNNTIHFSNNCHFERIQ